MEGVQREIPSPDRRSFLNNEQKREQRSIATSGERAILTRSKNVYNGERLYALFKCLKLEQLHNKSDLHMLNKIETGTKQITEQITSTLEQLHSLSKKIELIEDQASENIRKLVNEVTLQKDPMELHKKTHEVSVRVPLSLITPQQLVGILQYLRTEPQYLCDALARGGWFYDPKTTKYHSKMSRILVLCLFRGAFTPLDEKYLLQFILDICKTQFILCTEEFHLSPFFKKLMVAYVRYTPVHEYLRITLQDTLLRVQDPEFLQSEVSTGKLASLGEELAEKLSERISSLPFGLRVITQHLVTVAAEQGLSKEKINSLVREIIIDQFILLCISYPSLYTAIVGLNVSASHTHLQQLGEKLKVILSSSPVMLKYIEDIVAFDGTNYLRSLVDDVQVLRTFTITKSELEMILDLIIQVRTAYSTPAPSTSRTTATNNVTVSGVLSLSTPTVTLTASAATTLATKLPPSKLSMETDGLRKLLDDFIGEQKQVAEKTSYHRIHPRCFLMLTLPKAYRWKPPLRHDPITKEVKRTLISVLSELSYLSGYLGQSVLSTLESLTQSSPSKGQVSLWAQLREVIRALKELPQPYRDNDFELLLDQMFEDNKNRVKEQTALIEETLLSWDQIQHLSFRMRRLKNMFLEHFSNIKLEQFNKERFSGIMQKFIEEFHKRFKDFTVCTCNLMDSSVCDTCSAKSSMIKQFLEEAKQLLKANELWSSVEPEELVIASMQLERALMDQLYDKTFVHVVNDVTLKKYIHSTATWDLYRFDIAPKYHGEAPWPFARAELEKMSSLKAPYDKFRCISTCWEVISNCVSLIDDPGPDACFPIMSYIIYSIAPESDFFANIHYINMYCNVLSDMEEGRLLAFRTVVKALYKLLHQELNKS